jgi:thiol:disulfide interchange protein
VQTPRRSRSRAHFKRIKTRRLDAAIAEGAAYKTVMLDFYDWCASCKEMEVHVPRALRGGAHNTVLL